MLRYVLLWFPLLIAAVANGALREATYARHMSELRAHQLSTAIGAALLGALMWLFISTWPPASGRDAWIVGLLWLGLTVAFECFMGLALRKKPLSEVLADYNVVAGRVWPLLLLWITVAPRLLYALTVKR